MSAAQKKQYEALAKQDRIRYAKEMETYNEVRGSTFSEPKKQKRVPS